MKDNDDYRGVSSNNKNNETTTGEKEVNEEHTTISTEEMKQDIQNNMTEIDRNIFEPSKPRRIVIKGKIINE
jgi:hypothetical protein